MTKDTMLSPIVGMLLALGLALGFVLGAASAGEGQQWILLHHESQGEGDPSWTKCMPDDAWNGHEDHDGDWFEGPFDNNRCEETQPTAEPTETQVPTEAPTGDPTDAPTAEPTGDPTAQPTADPGQPTPTPTADPGQPTRIPTEGRGSDNRLPNTGLPGTADPFTWAPELWQEDGLPDNLWLTHNGSNTAGFGAQLVTLQRGDVFEHASLGGVDYEVVGVLRLEATDTWVLGAVEQFGGLVLMTCSGYNTQTLEWRYRVFVFLQELPK